MKKQNLIGSLCWFVVGCLFCVGAAKHRLLLNGLPGAGFFPFVLGIILMTLSFFDLIFVIYRMRKDAGTTGEGNFFTKPDSWKKLSIAVVGLLVYASALEYLGFPIMTFLFILFLMRFVEPQKWPISLGVSAVTTIISYVMFSVWLKVLLPKGILGI